MMRSLFAIAAPALVSATLLIDIGGAASVDALVDGMYVKILLDNDLKDMFPASGSDDMTALKNHQKSFLKSLCGAATSYSASPNTGYPLTNKGIGEAHATVNGGNYPTLAHFNKVAGHVDTTMTDLGVSSANQTLILAALTSLKTAVIGTETLYQRVAAAYNPHPTLGTGNTPLVVADPVSAVVDQLYTAILGDADQAFKDMFPANPSTAFTALKMHQTDFLKVAFGDTATTYSGRGMTESHAKINNGGPPTEAQWGKVVGHLVTALNAVKAPWHFQHSILRVALSVKTPILAGLPDTSSSFGLVPGLWTLAFAAIARYLLH